MARSRQGAAKRARERARQERQAAKRARRFSSQDEVEADTESIDEAALLAEFHGWSERHAAGVIDDDVYRAERERIFLALGLEGEPEA